MQRVSSGRRKLLGIATLVLALGLWWAPMARAGDVVLRVDGLACPFCAFGVEKKLLKIPAVSGIDIRMNEGKVVVRLREGERLDAVALNRAVEDAGFTLRKILVEKAVGTLSRDDEGHFLLRCSDPASAFRLRFEDEDALPGITPKRGVTAVEVTGEVTEYMAEPTPLVVTSLRPVGDPSGGLP